MTFLERLHLLRAFMWPALLPVLLVLHAEQSVFVVLCLSLYANFASDIASWQAARAERSSNS